MPSVIVELIGFLVQLEADMTKAWSEGGSREVMQEAPKRLEAEGWESVRLALSVTVR
jgi:hypothetical protein